MSYELWAGDRPAIYVIGGGIADAIIVLVRLRLNSRDINAGLEIVDRAV